MTIKEHDDYLLSCEICNHKIVSDEDGYSPCDHVIYTITDETFPDMPETDKYNKSDEITKLYNEDDDDEKDIKDILKEVFKEDNYILFWAKDSSGLRAYNIIENKEV